MSAPTRDPLTVQTQDGSSWRRRAQDTAGHGLYARSDSTEACPTLRTIRELAEFGLRGMSAPVADVPQGYPPAMPWAGLLDHEDLTDFLDELAAAAITHASSEVALVEVEKACGTWRLIAEAQHGHNMAPGPKSAEGEHYAIVHHAYTTGRDLPEPGGQR